ncbi:MAG: Hsp20/alpha crystallin family protein [Oligoflexia bacterium]|nr:Hsp20/alpha crystallin family protein [Oligoflexia bacterium]
MFWETIYDLQRELDQMYSSSSDSKSTFSRGIFPAINIFEKDEVLIIKTEIPSIDKKNINIKLQGDNIMISGERNIIHEKNCHYHRRERKSGSFNRQFKLPYRINQDTVKASIEDGVLTLLMNKAESEKTKVISIQ